MLNGVFFATAFATILTPGPNMMYVAATSAERGTRVGAIAAAAVTLGGVFYTLVTSAGISAAMAAYPAVFTVIRIAGALYLVYLGVRLLLRVRDTSPPAPAANAHGHAFRVGLTISLTNPQLALFFLSFLSQFIVAGGQPVWLQLLELGLTFNCCSLLVTLCVAMLTGTAGHARTSGVRFRQVIRAVAGVAFLALAVRTTLSVLHR